MYLVFEGCLFATRFVRASTTTYKIWIYARERVALEGLGMTIGIINRN